MSVRSNSSGDQLVAAASLGLSTGQFRLCGWIDLLSDRNDFGGFAGFGSEATDGTTKALFGVDSSGTALGGFATSGQHSGGTIALSLSTWTFVVMSESTGNDWIIRAFDDSASTTPIGSLVGHDLLDDFTTADNVVIGQMVTGEWADFEACNFKLVIGGSDWTDAECRTESQLFEVQAAKGGTVFGSWRLEDTDDDTDGLRDGSGAGHHLTNTGFVNGSSRPNQLQTLTSSPATGLAESGPSLTPLLGGLFRKMFARPRGYARRPSGLWIPECALT